MKTPVEILKGMEAVRASGITNMMDAKVVVAEMVADNVDEAMDYFLVRKTRNGVDSVVVDTNKYLQALSDLSQYRYTQEK